MATSGELSTWFPLGQLVEQERLLDDILNFFVAHAQARTSERNMTHMYVWQVTAHRSFKECQSESSEKNIGKYEPAVLA